MAVATTLRLFRNVSCQASAQQGLPPTGCLPPSNCCLLFCKCFCSNKTCLHLSRHQDTASVGAILVHIASKNLCCMRAVRVQSFRAACSLLLPLTSLVDLADSQSLRQHDTTHDNPESGCLACSHAIAFTSPAALLTLRDCVHSTIRRSKHRSFNFQHWQLVTGVSMIGRIQR